MATVTVSSIGSPFGA